MRNTLSYVLILISTSLLAQEKLAVDSIALRSIDGIVNEMLRIQSGEKGKIRDWDSYRNLFLPSAHFTVLTHDDTMNLPLETANLEEFLEYLLDPYYDQGYIEYEINKVVDEYNGIAQVFQTYFIKDGESNEEMGITSYQLVFYKERWWIVNILWTGDGNGVKVPGRYLKK